MPSSEFFVAQSEDSEPSSIRLTRRDDRSLGMAILQNVLRPLRGGILSKIPDVPPGSIKITVPPLTGCSVQVRRVQDVYVYDISQQQPSHSNNRATSSKRIYYIAGGSWQMLPTKQHWLTLAELVRELDHTEVSLVSLPLAQHAPASKQWPQLLELYRTLMQPSISNEEEKIIWAGDSSGGNIVLALTIDALKNDPGIPPPDAIMAISPSIDLTRTNPRISEVDKNDPVLTIPGIHKSAAAWAGEWDPKDPRLSPLFADLRVLKENGVQVHGVTAGYDVLGPDGVLFRQKCAEEGVKGQWLEWDRQMHAFPLTWMFLSDGREALRWIMDVLRRV